MRTFHIFNVNPYVANLIKEDSYPLFNSFLKIKNLSNNDLSMGINIYEQIALPINKDVVNKRIYKFYTESCFYTKYLNRHTYIDKYKGEESYLNVDSSCIRLKTNMHRSSFLKCFSKSRNLFVCDFENKDYFWIDNIL